jgi:hypothetical protein
MSPFKIGQSQAKLGLPLQHFGGWVPIRPFLFAVNGSRTRPPKSLPTDADPVTDRLPGMPDRPLPIGMPRLARRRGGEKARLRARKCPYEACLGGLVWNLNSADHSAGVENEINLTPEFVRHEVPYETGAVPGLDLSCYRRAP